MSLTLTADISATARTLTVTGTVPVDIRQGYRFRLDDELLTLSGFGLHEVQYPERTQLDVNRNEWRVKRAQGGTVAASHSAGTTIEAVLGALVAAADDDPLPDPFASGGGGSLPTGWTQDGGTGAVDTGGQAIAGVLQSRDFLFTEVADSATYEASLPVLAGTVVMDVILYPLAAPWAADFPCAFAISDTVNGPGAYGAQDLGGLSPSYDPPTNDPAAVGSDYQNMANNGGGYNSYAWNDTNANPGGPGVRYVADDEIVMSLTTVNAAPVTPVGILLVKVIYFAPITAVAAVVT